jgi:selenocysteine lyase/cysteine desulfurase
VGLRQTLVVHRLLGSWVSDRVRALRRRLLDRIADLPFTVRSTPEAPTGIVVVEPKGGDVAALVQRMWDEERIAVKLIDEPGIAPAIRLSFWALHKEKDIDRLAAAFARTLVVGVR